MPRNRYLQEFELQVLLAIVTLGDSAYGAEIQRELDQRTGRSVAIGSIYATLARLLDRGIVRRHATAPLPVQGGRSRNCYELTATGRESVQRSVSALSAMIRAAGIHG